MVAWLLFLPMALQGVPLVVNTADSGAGSLRQAIADAPDGSSIILEPTLSGQTITLTSGPIVIDKSVFLSASNLPAGLTISGGNAIRIFNVTEEGSLQLIALTLRDGRAPTGASGSFGNSAGTFTAPTAGGAGSPGGNGGAILNAGELVLTGCTLTGNRAGNGGIGGNGGNAGGSFPQGAAGGAGGAGGQGGAVFNTGSLSVNNCTFSGNSAGNGGNGGSGGSSFFSGRAAGGSGGAGGGGGALAGDGAMPIDATTVALNAAGVGGAPGLGSSLAGNAGRGGGILSGPLTSLRNSLIADNSVADSGIGRDVSGTVISLGYNLVSRSDGSSGWDGSDLLGSNAAPRDPQLAALGNNGGPTHTHALPSGSSAVDAANPSLGGIDQRSLPRNSGGRSDIGSFEYQYPPLLVVRRGDNTLVPKGGTIDLGRMNPGGEFSVTLTLLSEGVGPLTGIQALLLGPDAAEFTLNPPAAGTLAPQQSTTVRVNFTPSSPGTKSVTLRILSNDESNSPFDVQITAVSNARPTDIISSFNGIEENRPPGTLIGTLQTIDPNPDDSHTLAIDGVLPASGAGNFILDGNEVRTTGPLDYETQNGYLLYIRATDLAGAFVTKELPIRVIDKDEAPLVSNIPDLVLANGATLQPIQFTVNDPQLPNLLTVTSPARAAGNYAMSAAAYGPPFPSAGLPVEFAVASPVLGNGDSTTALTNAEECADKAVLMQRGAFSFVTKTRNAQNSGAIATVVFQDVLGTYPSGMSGFDPLVTIPSGMISRADGLTLAAAVHDSPVTGVIRSLPLSLDVAASSDNPLLLPPAGISLGGAGPQRSLTLAPLPGVAGSAMVTVTATDNAGNVTTRTFQFTVPDALVDLRLPDGSPLSSGGAALDFGTLTLGESAARSVTIRNTGGLVMSLGAIAIEGGGALSYIVDSSALPSTLAPGGEAVFDIIFKPIASGGQIANLRIATSASNLPDFTLAVTGMAFSTTEDADGDGLNDAAEFRLAALGFDWQTAQPDKVAAYFAAANLAGLYRKDQVQALGISTPFIERSPSGQVTLRLKLNKSTDLQQFLPFDFSAGELATDPSRGGIELRFTPVDDAAFFRIETD